MPISLWSQTSIQKKTWDTENNSSTSFRNGRLFDIQAREWKLWWSSCLEAIKDSEYEHNLIATTRINQPNKLTKKDFENAEVLVMNYASWNNRPGVHWYRPIRHKQTANLAEKVDTIDVQINYAIKNSMNGFVSNFNIWIIKVADQQFKSEETKPRPTTKQTVKELTKKNKLKLW